MKTIAFFNRKGGVGKTAISFLFARYLSEAKNKVLFIDADPQRAGTNHAARLESIPRKEYESKNLFNVLMNKATVQESVIPAGKMDLLAGSYDIAEIQSTTSPFSFKEITDSAKEYDYSVIDNAPNWSALIQATLYAADIIVIPSLPNIEDLEQAAWSLMRAKKINPSAKIKILLNQYGLAGKLEEEILGQFSAPFNGYLIKDLAIPRTKIVNKYLSTGERVTARAKSKAEFMNTFHRLSETIIGNSYLQMELF